MQCTNDLLSSACPHIWKIMQDEKYKEKNVTTQVQPGPSQSRSKSAPTLGESVLSHDAWSQAQMGQRVIEDRATSAMYKRTNKK